MNISGSLGQFLYLVALPVTSRRTLFQIHIPRLLQAVAFAVGDYHIYKLCKAVYGRGAAGWTLVCLATAWFLGYCAPRTLTSCVETVLLAVAFTHYPWRREKGQWRKYQQSFLIYKCYFVSTLALFIYFILFFFFFYYKVEQISYDSWLLNVAHCSVVMLCVCVQSITVLGICGQ